MTSTKIFKQTVGADYSALIACLKTARERETETMSKIALTRTEEETSVTFTYRRDYVAGKLIADTFSLLSVINADLAMDDSDTASYFTKTLIPEWVKDEYVLGVLLHGFQMSKIIDGEPYLYETAGEVGDE